MKSKAILFIVLFVLMCAGAYAQQMDLEENPATVEAKKGKQRFGIGAGYWYTWGTTDYYVYASEDIYINGILMAEQGEKVSELNNKIDSGIFVVDADAWIWWRLYADGFVGFGNFDGEHKDSDWLPSYTSAKLQYSKSDAKGDVTLWNLNARLRIIEEEEDKGYLDGAIGYFYYQDDIKHIENSTITIYNWQPVSIPLLGHDSSDKYTYRGLRLGLKGMIRLHDRVAIKANAGICPWLDIQDKKYWNLREDYGPPPGMKATIDMDGTSYDLDIALEIKIFKNLFVEGGYKYISFDSDKGDDKRTWNSGVTDTYKDAGEVRADRGGFYGMVRLKI